VFAKKVFKITQIILLLFSNPVVEHAYCYEPVRKSNFVKGWLLGGDGGLNVVVAEDFKPLFPASAFYGTGLTLRLLSEYRLTPELSIRPLAGYTISSWYYKKNRNIFTSESGALDLKFDVINFVSGYQPFRKTSFYIFAGGGMLCRNNISNGNFIDNLRFLYLVRTGGGIEYRLKKSVLMTLNAELNFTGDKLNGYDAGKRSYDILPCLTMGLTYDFTPTLWGRWNY
jgi:hypothetical protein